MSNFMEENLDLPVRDLLKVIQARMTQKSTYFGVQTMKSPTDFWIYQELIFEKRPDVIIEIGNYSGGSTLALAHLCDNIGHGRVIGVDITHVRMAKHIELHPRITLFEGDACELFPKISSLIGENERVFIIEDSAHTFQNTLKVLQTYSVLLQQGDYFVVEDSICHHGLNVGPQPGPYEAIETFISENHAFEIDREREDFLITWNPKGYLRCIGNTVNNQTHLPPRSAAKPKRKMIESLRKWVLLLSRPIIVQYAAKAQAKLAKASKN